MLFTELYAREVGTESFCARSRRYEIHFFRLLTISGSCARTTISFAIDLACSGFYSLIGFTMFSVFTAYISKGSLPKKLLVFSLGIPLIYALNIFRIVMLILIGYFSGPEQALNVFHFLGGWTLIFFGTLFLLTITEKIFKFNLFKKSNEKGICKNLIINGGYCSVCGEIKKVFFHFSENDLIKSVFLLIMVFSSIFVKVPVFALTEGGTEILTQQITGGQTTSMILPEIEGYEPKFVYEDVEFEQIPGQDASLMYIYEPENPVMQPIWVMIEIASAKGRLHSWEVCLITWPESHGEEVRVTKLDLRDEQIMNNPPLTARHFVFKNRQNDRTQVTLYWYTRSVFKTKEGYEKKYSKISLVEFTKNPEDFQTIQEELISIATAIVNHWNPTRKISSFSLIFLGQKTNIILIVSILLISTVIYLIYINWKKCKAARHVFSNIIENREHEITNIIKSIKTDLVNLSKIRSKYKELTGKNIKSDELYSKLIETEKIGLIERKIINVNNVPYISWRLNI